MIAILIISWSQDILQILTLNCQIIQCIYCHNFTSVSFVILVGLSKLLTNFFLVYIIVNETIIVYGVSQVAPILALAPWFVQQTKKQLFLSVVTSILENTCLVYLYSWSMCSFPYIEQHIYTDVFSSIVISEKGCDGSQSQVATVLALAPWLVQPQKKQLFIFAVTSPKETRQVQWLDGFCYCSNHSNHSQYH